MCELYTWQRKTATSLIVVMKTRTLHIALLVLYLAQVIGLTIAIGVYVTNFDLRIYWTNETFVIYDSTWNPVYLLLPYMGVPVLFHLGFLMAQRYDYIRVGDLSTPETSWTHFVRWMEIGVTHSFALVFAAQVSGNSDMWVLIHITSHTLGLHVVGYLSEFERKPRIYLGAVIPALAILANIAISVFYDKTAQELWLIVFVIMFQAFVSTGLHAFELYDGISYRTLEQAILILNFCARTIVAWEGFHYVQTR